MNARLIRSRAVAPMDGRIIDDGAVAIIAGRLAAVGTYANLSREFAAAPCEDIGDCVLLPGLINAHVHLELSDCTPDEKPTGGLEQWLTRMLSRTRIDVTELERKSAAAAQVGARECLKYGVTAVGDISRQCHVTRPALRDGPLRVVSFGEVMAMAQRRALLEPRLALAADVSCASDHLQLGISPHSPYSIEPAGIARCLEVAKANHLPLAMHLAETHGEWEFLASHSGPLKELWDAWLTWDEQVPRYADGPIMLARELGLLEYGALLAHVNYCSDEELATLARGRASVVYCPRTHDFFSHPPHRFREMLAAGINVALGTDSCASSPNLNLLDDLRLVHVQHPDLDLHALWQLITANAARAVGMASAGRLAPGCPADMVAFAIRTKPLLDPLDPRSLPRQVWIGGAVVSAAPVPADASLPAHLT